MNVTTANTTTMDPIVFATTWTAATEKAVQFGMTLQHVTFGSPEVRLSFVANDRVFGTNFPSVLEAKAFLDRY